MQRRRPRERGTDREQNKAGAEEQHGENQQGQGGPRAAVSKATVTQDGQRPQILQRLGPLREKA